MAIVEHVTRRKYLGEDGQPRTETTRHGYARRPESLAEFIDQRVASLGIAGRLATGKMALRLLLADGDGLADAVKAARDLSPEQRWGCWRGSMCGWTRRATPARLRRRRWTRCAVRGGVSLRVLGRGGFRPLSRSPGGGLACAVRDHRAGEARQGPPARLREGERAAPPGGR